MKTLIIKCTDFRTLRLTFIKGKVTTRADGQPILLTNADGNVNESDDDEEEDAAEQKSISKTLSHIILVWLKKLYWLLLSTSKNCNYTLYFASDN